MIRPVGVSAGGIGLVLAWVGGLAIARLTGATPVVIVLAAGLVLFVAAIFDGLASVVRTSIDSVVLPHTSVQGEPVALAARVDAPRPVWVEVSSAGRDVAAGWSTRRSFSANATFARRGAIDRLDLRCRSAGALGLVWWGRRTQVDVGRHLVAPAAHPGDVPVERSGHAADGDLAGASGAVSGEVDGVRPWRDGDSEKFVHWATSMRSGALMVHDRRQDADQRWVVRARFGTPDPDREAGAARCAIEQGLRSGVAVLCAVDAAEPVVIDNGESAVEWAALVDLGRSDTVDRSWRHRFRRVEPDATATIAARWWAAAATLTALLMLAGALTYPIAGSAAICLGVAAGAAVSGRSLLTGEQPPAAVRALVGVGGLAGLGVVIASSVQLDTLAVLRGPLPLLLVGLIVLHGFECRDRRTIRVSLGISAIVLMYASGLRVDSTIGWWLLAWAVAFGIALSQLAGPTRPDTPRPFGVSGRTSVRRVVGVVGGAVATAAVLAVVPVPDGPAQLTLPTLITNATQVGTPGAIAGPDGTLRDVGAEDADGRRAPAGQAGGYTGFADSMDTSVRGELGDTIVMRVRAAEPDFWRGQTFSRFDGRRWYADEAVGELLQGPNIQLPRADGDRPVADDIEVGRFVQTYFVDVDMPNLIFHAGRADGVVADADVWARPDGALRASTVIPAGSIYTVVSSRVEVDAGSLARQGRVEDRLTDRGREVFKRYLDVPSTMSPETLALADRLATGRSSTYEVVRAFEAWMSDNVEYDLNAPLPEPGEDAVHDFLFDTQLGFCEQIASSLTIMLRTQGVPARVATGYLPGSRDEIAGVFEVRASDAHAWVEVWFPETGWQPFDPTANVPLAANAEIGSVGGDLISGLSNYLADHVARVMTVLASALGVAVVVQLARRRTARRRRGRWGVLQDRFASVASARGATDTAPNPVLADAWAGGIDEPGARLVAERLDRVAFDPGFLDTDEAFAETRSLVGALRSAER